MQPRRKTIYLDTKNVTLQPDGDALRVLQDNHAARLIPRYRVDRAVIRHDHQDLLQACLAIAVDGGTVHFQSPAGDVIGILHNPWAAGARWARDTAHTIERTSGCGPYHRWRNDQQRHAWSLVFRRNYCGDFESNRKRLIHYLLFFRPGIDISTETEWLEQQLWMWLQARFDRDGMQPIAHALSDKGEQLLQTLMPCLFIPLLWAFVRWRRQNATTVVTTPTHFFELQARTRLHNQLQRHMHALTAAYYDNRRVEETDATAIGPATERP